MLHLAIHAAFNNETDATRSIKKTKFWTECSKVIAFSQRVTIHVIKAAS